MESGKTHAAEAVHDISQAASEAAKELRRSLGERGCQCCDDVTDYIGKNPLQALALAGLAGMVVGLLLSRRRCAPQRRHAEDDRFE